MKWFISLIFGFSFLFVNGQNEFTATAFYKDFQKIYSDAQTGFTNYIGSERKNENEKSATEYNVKLMLPLADSGKIVIPATGLPYVIYYFEPDKMRLKVDQRGANLRDAILNVLGVQLLTRTETQIVDNRPLTNSWYFINQNEKRLAFADFHMTIYYENGKYNLSFEIRGKGN